MEVHGHGDGAHRERYEGERLGAEVEIATYCSVLIVGRILEEAVTAPGLAGSLRAMYRRLVSVRAEVVDPEWRENTASNVS